MNSQFLQQLPFLVIALIPALTFHEWGHSMMATLYGDPTPKMAGRLTLNPLAHLDLLGTIAIFLIHFGWAKPVPTNPAYYKGTWGTLWVASAGPLMNLLLAIFFGMMLRFDIWMMAPEAYHEMLQRVLGISLFMNLALAFFNLIPIGPLDGSHILERLLPYSKSLAFRDFNLQYGSMILLGLIILGQLHIFPILQILVIYPVHFLSSLLVGQSVL